MSILTLAGGVGGAKLALGLDRVLPAGEQTVVVNTGDDFEHLGLHIAPDIDTVVYTLAGLANRELGWGRQGESWAFMAALGALGGETWFNLGDGDLAMHVTRTQRLAAGETLSAITADIAARLGIRSGILPMSDQPVRTVIETPEGDLAFQHWFVRDRCGPAVRAVRFAGIEAAKPLPAFVAALRDPALKALVIAPSNPFVSIAPILGLAGIDAAIRGLRRPRIAVSPIVGGAAIKGPAAKMLAELGHDVSALGVARCYAGLIDVFVLDAIDAALKGEIEGLGMRCAVFDTVMRNDGDKEALARAILALVES